MREAVVTELPCHVAIGMFDGVHRGHRVVIESAVETARHAGELSGVLTFWPHPSRLFRPEDPTRMIFDAATRRKLLLEVGVGFVIEQPFDRAFAAIRAQEFLGHLCRALPRLSTLYVGENWRFGHGRQGDVALLVRLARAEGINVVSAERLNFNGQPVSSSRIRTLLAGGEVGEAAELLGFPFFAEGRVVPGRQLGRTIGAPTLNLDWRADLQPAYGVYAVRVRGAADGDALPAVANYGVRPTVGGGDPLLEVHVLGECPFGAGDFLRVDWLWKVRAERRFASLEDLKAQIANDREAAFAFFSAHRGTVQG